MQTILHEAAHELGFVRDVSTTSRQGRYHNQRFVSIAQELGLDYVHEHPNTTIGFSEVTLTPEGASRWSREIDALHEAITLTLDDPLSWLTPLTIPGGAPAGLGGHGVPVPKGMGRRGTGGGSYVKLQCQCPYTIRAAASTVEATSIVCGTCGSEFTS